VVAPPVPAPLPQADHLPDDPLYLKHLILDLVRLLQASRHESAGLRQRVDELLQRLRRLPHEQWPAAQLLLFPELRGPQEEEAPPPPPPPSEEQGKKKAKGKPHGRNPLPAHLERVRIEHPLSEAERVCLCCGGLRDVLSEVITEQLDYRPATLFVNEHVRFTYICQACAQGKTAVDDTGMSVEPTATPELPSPGATMSVEATAAPELPRPAATSRVPETSLPDLKEVCLVPADAAAGSTLIRSPRVELPVDRGLPGPGLLAYVGVSKFGDHLPLYRLETILSRLGVEIARSTMCDWLAAGGDLLRPLVDLLGRRLLLSHVIHTDDTTVPLRALLGEKHVQSRLWTYIGDRHYPYTVFAYTRTHQRDGPNQFLQDFHGYLQADAYTGYDGLYLDPTRDIREVACWAHARRKFDEARCQDPVRAAEALAFIRRLYDVEDEALSLAAGDLDRLEAERLRLRQSTARPLLDQFHTWLVAQRAALLPKQKMMEAIQYVLNNWEAFVRYTEVGATAIDNNVAERTLRRVGLGRKNYLFFGADSGGHTAALFYSLIATCDRHQVEPWRYLTDVFDRLAGLREVLRQAERTNDASARDSLLEPLLPDVWKQSHPEAVVLDVHNLGRPHRRR
jgi:transposase